MSDLQKIQQQVKIKMMSYLMEGVGRFPTPSFPVAQPHRVDHSPQTTQVSACNRCELAQCRKRVVVATQYELRDYFVLADFPDVHDEQSSDVFATSSPLSAIAINLLHKLKIFSHCHFSFALKCVPTKLFPLNALTTCALSNLAPELTQVSPKMILCFGQKAFRALSCLDPLLVQTSYEENTQLRFVFRDNMPITLFFLPSLQDLRDFPQWRKQVWDLLSGAIPHSR
jgi:uracil-DNA glycosylase